MTRRRVVVTGLGIISPVGNTVASAWDSIVNGRSGIDRVTRFDASVLPTRIAGEVKGFDVSAYLSTKEARRFDTFIHYGLAAAMDAIKDAGITEQPSNPERIGVCIGSGIGGLPLIEDTMNAIAAGGARKISPFFVPGSIINMISGVLSINYGFQGPNFAVVSACASGNHAIGEAQRLIEYGDADIMIAGGAESTVSLLGMGGFCSAKALSVRNDDPQTASRPWDSGRDGFVLGEGAGILVLEEYEHAKARGAKIYAEVAGYGMSSDAYHVTAPAEGGEGAARSVANALRNSRIATDEVDYVNAHGTSTPLGDIAETMAAKRCFGAHASKLAMSSTKSMTGHLLGAAAGVEAVFSVLAIRDQIAPPTINLHNPDPACDLDYVPNVARNMPINVVVSNSFGFGGTNSTLVFRKI
ncbi:beta-ketoacyl-ACP synthase II [Uliginosibacterium flavum]|uniref:3-oxoacyl-[acyl-carrier-protein] synthase 2 n=1 Tax=Uliginosibacterium flavum TaxID=1396831 RepID=A0ABV2TNF3_9RHOO